MKKYFYLKKTLLAAMVLLIACGPLSAQDNAQNVRKPVIVDEDLVILTEEITENALFFPVEIEGTYLEVLAVRAPDGTIRTAFNTCHVCYRSGNGHYVQEGSVLVCQNCKNRYNIAQVEKEAGGCNPEPIFPANKAVTDTSITILKEYMKEFVPMFALWKRL